MPEAKNLLSASDLTRGEKLYLHRKRLGMNQVRRCVDLEVGYAQYRAMEVDSSTTTPPYQSIGPMEERESYMILRRRQGMTKGDLAEAVGCSTEWLRQMESGQASIRRLQEYWESVL